MASQKTTDKTMVNKAKELGIKSPHLMNEDTLIARINEVEEKQMDTKPEVKGKERKVAPSMNVSNIARDDRTALIDDLQAKDPDCKYMFQSSRVTDKELAAKGLERTEFALKNDIVCRTLKDSFENWQDTKNETEFESMQRIDGGSGKVGSHTASAKQPRSSGN